MAGPTLHTEVHILQKAPPKEAFQPATAYSAEHGTLRILQRVPRKPTPNHIGLDLFDHAALILDAGSGGTWFVKEVRLLHRHTGIGQNYRRLQHASTFTALIARNPVHEESRESVDALLHTALHAFATSDRPDIVGFKSLYCFARDEGYPLKQHWYPTLPRDDRTDLAALLNQPVAELVTSTDRVAHLQRRLEDYLRGHTDILVE
ncbi:hypothetical protein [Actomonas aquatica]|uniref:Uncharacterized protein n=1 Tax=Actomonas aquatica TaxID=2866162 RepID=A0ABZ1CCE7_9BACT|nr:hypothetical protein [Opitutus sp. WL0086]WRQ89163.1 hypothetical protein K1X11_007065 [Opitutus sp. WL0086]